MFNKRNWILVLFTLVLMSGAALAQDSFVNDPDVNPDANACFAGGSLEGQCETETEWIVGWIMIRYEEGLIDADGIPNGWESFILGTQDYCAVEVDAEGSEDEDSPAEGYDIYDGDDFLYFTTDPYYDEC